MILENIDLFNLEPMKYWSMNASWSNTEKQDKLEMIVKSKNYIFSEKKDGNLIRAIITPERFALQTRGRSVNTKEFGEIQDKVFWSNSIKKAFEDTTILLGEAYIEGGTDKDCGAVLRCLSQKAIERQKKEDKFIKYYIFDVLAYNGEFFFDKPIEERIKYLSQIEQDINNYLVSTAIYREVDETYFDYLNNIFSYGGEGTVLYKKTMLPCEGRTKAWDTIKIKQELKDTVDAFVTAIELAKEEYTGKEPQNWKYWKSTKTEQLLPEGNYYYDYINGDSIMPVTKSYYYNLPGAMVCSVYDNNGNEKTLCKVSNITDTLAYDLRDNFKEKYYLKPCRIDGMLISKNRFGDISIRHPKFIEFRDDIELKDCTLEKII